MTLDEALSKTVLDKDDLVFLLGLTDPRDVQRLHDAAYAAKCRHVGNVAYYRGLIEFSNICVKNCLYCGIRRGNENVRRFDTPREDILAMARWCHEQGYGSVTLQSGERTDAAFAEHVEGLVRDIKKIGGGGLGITLCAGEQSEETYRRWFAAGAHRYLLRIETSRPELYAALHPGDGMHVWKNRYNCLRVLGKIGYQVGTGVMIGLPGQTLGDLADDILFFQTIDAAMIGMGPYVVHKDTPVGQAVLASGENSDECRQKRLLLGLNMIAVTRLALKDVNIAATTALQALHPEGRELGLKAGANILMPIVTLPRFRRDYQLYEGKPCINESSEDCRNCLERRVRSAGDSVGWGRWGDSPHFARCSQ